MAYTNEQQEEFDAVIADSTRLALLFLKAAEQLADQAENLQAHIDDALDDGDATDHIDVLESTAATLDTMAEVGANLLNFVTQGIVCDELVNAVKIGLTTIADELAEKANEFYSYDYNPEEYTSETEVESGGFHPNAQQLVAWNMAHREFDGDIYPQFIDGGVSFTTENGFEVKLLVA